MFKSVIIENREHFTTHGFHMNCKGKFWIINKWTYIILSTLSRLQTTPATPLPWIKENENSLVEHVNKNDSIIEERNILKEDETRKYRILKLKKPGDQKVSLLKNEEYHSAMYLKVFTEDNEEEIDLIDLFGSSQSVTSDQDNNLVKDKVNLNYFELEKLMGPAKKQTKKKLQSLMRRMKKLRTKQN